jgi:hypothetical protein
MIHGEIDDDSGIPAKGLVNVLAKRHNRFLFIGTGVDESMQFYALLHRGRILFERPLTLGKVAQQGAQAKAVIVTRELQVCQEIHLRTLTECEKRSRKYSYVPLSARWFEYTPALSFRLF